ncbi:hypothetical protein, partial [Acinetobacter baumannii]|uniref:hypothetical protein n=1 Tax=Acinetobacter baumannii TaxID=470 RepID=UPI001C09462A
MGSCAAPSAKGDDKFITTDYLQQCQKKGEKSKNSTESAGRLGHAKMTGTKQRKLYQAAKSM